MILKIETGAHSSTYRRDEAIQLLHAFHVSRSRSADGIVEAMFSGYRWWQAVSREGAGTMASRLAIG
jgi:hypothetical protein